MRHILILFSFIFLLGCSDKEEANPNYSIIPNIEIESYDQLELIYSGNQRFGDIHSIKLHYKDGDSNLGLGHREENEPYHYKNPDGSINKFHYNFIIKTFKHIDGEFVQLYEDFSHLRFPLILDNKEKHEDNVFVIEPVSKWEGYLTINYRLEYLDPDTYDKGDIIKFEIQILDRDLNYSNILITQEIVAGME